MCFPFARRDLNNVGDENKKKLFLFFFHFFFFIFHPRLAMQTPRCFQMRQTSSLSFFLRSSYRTSNDTFSTSSCRVWFFMEEKNWGKKKEEKKKGDRGRERERERRKKEQNNTRSRRDISTRFLSIDIGNSKSLQILAKILLFLFI